MKILIVDDDKAMRAVLRSVCEGEGHQVLAEFGDGAGLLDFVAATPPDLVCLDYNLPGANGLEVLVDINSAADHVDVIMITGSDDPELKGHAADLGAHGFIHKPFAQSQIVAELRDVQATRRIAARTTAAEPVAMATLAAAPERPPGVVPRSAVIIDDSGSIRLLLKGILEEAGIRVIGVACNGRDGIEAVRKLRPALVCLDVDMPLMTGIEALPQVRAASPQSKVVMITGNASRAIVEAAVAGGAKGYFLKPIRPAKVEEFIGKLMSGKT